MGKASTEIIFRKFESCEKLENFANKFCRDKKIVRKDIKIFYHPKSEIVFYFLILEYS